MFLAREGSCGDFRRKAFRIRADAIYVTRGNPGYDQSSEDDN
jgi:hypothetical protein